MQGIGIGPALRKARLLRGKSIQEASRETRIRPEYLNALERERFEALLGDVYVRGFLRSYSTYLGLDADKVLTVYNRHFGQLAPTLPEPELGPARAARGPGSTALPHLGIHHPSWRALIAIALFALAVLGAVGFLSRSKSVPPSGTVRGAGSIPVLPPTVTVAVRAVESVELTVRLDGGSPAVYLLRRDEFRSFQGQSRIDVALERGSSALLIVNGVSLGTPGDPSKPFSASYGPRDFAGGQQATAPPSSVPVRSPSPTSTGPSPGSSSSATSP